MIEIEADQLFIKRLLISHTVTMVTEYMESTFVE